MTHISVIIPVYKAENCLHELYRRLQGSLEVISNDFEIILVEDGGGDRSWSIIVELAKLDERVKGIKLSRNFGQHAATICGISKASGEWIITIDDDLEQSPEDIYSLYEKANEGYHLVYGVYKYRSHSFWRNITSQFARILFKIAIPTLNYDYTSFRIIKKEIAKNLAHFDAPFPFIDGYLSWLTHNYAIVTVKHYNRASGHSNYTFLKLLTHTLNIFVTFSDLPLRCVTWVGLISFLIGVFLSFLIVANRLIGGITVSGYTSIITSLIIFSGLQLLVLGIIGEYLSRINFKTSKKPLFLVLIETSKPLNK